MPMIIVGPPATHTSLNPESLEVRGMAWEVYGKWVPLVGVLGEIPNHGEFFTPRYFCCFQSGTGMSCSYLVTIGSKWIYTPYIQVGWKFRHAKKCEISTNLLVTTPPKTNMAVENDHV